MIRVFVICEKFFLWKKLLDTAKKAGLGAAKAASKNVVRKIVEVTGLLTRNKITEKIVKPKPVPEMNLKNVEKNSYSTRKKARNTKRSKTSITKIEHYKISKLLNYSTVSKFVTGKWIKVNDLSNGQYSPNKNINFKTPVLRFL